MSYFPKIAAAIQSINSISSIRLRLKFLDICAVSMASEIRNVSNGTSNDKIDLRRGYQVVVAATKEMGIGKDGKLPWKLPSDLKFFKDITLQTSNAEKKNAIIMGRKTWESIPRKNRPLPGRLNVVLTHSRDYDVGSLEDVVTCGSINSALELLGMRPYDLLIERVFVIGGGQILREALNAPACDAIHITEIETDIECDTFMPPVDNSLFQPWYSSFPSVENNIRHSFVTYVRVRRTATDIGTQINTTKALSSKSKVQDFSFLPQMVFDRHQEHLYLKLVQEILSSGNLKDDRTGTGTLSKFGCQVLQEKGIHIWDGNASRIYLDSIGLPDREEGDLGPVYGFQWRYTSMHADYTGQGFDQLLDVIHKIKNKPDDRRIILSAWNPSDLKLMALPPCHMFSQFYVANGELSCQMYQRSADMGLGVPFNIASYALLTCMIAHVCDLIPGDFIHVIGDTHVYRNHIEPLQEQLQNLPKPFPVLKINTQKKNIDSFVATDFELVGYDPHQKIEMKMAV
uniref:Bifunctional dihydrofolate reductase-thymidylate synthase n=1 Tax=Chenopodium quinoa TaxID=63459 RepID=A0A803LDN7_CHEQI